MRERISIGVSSDRQSYFFQEAISSSGRSDDPSDFYKALDNTLVTHPHQRFFAAVWSSIEGFYPQGIRMGGFFATGEIKENEESHQNKDNICDVQDKSKNNDDQAQK